MFYIGTIQRIFPPGSKYNLNGYQYEYSVLITGPNSCQIPLNNVIVMDEFGSPNDFNDRILSVDQKVIVTLLNDNPSHAVIIGCIRNSTIAAQPNERYWRRRFNKIEEYINQKNVWELKSDNGPLMQLTPTSIILDDSVGNKIILDKENKKIVINGNELSIVVEGNVQIQVKGNLTADVSNQATIKCKQLDAKVDGECSITAQSINLNKVGGGVVTQFTHPICFVTGMPIQGSKTVKAGG